MESEGKKQLDSQREEWKDRGDRNPEMHGDRCGKLDSKKGFVDMSKQFSIKSEAAKNLWQNRSITW